MFEMNDRVPMFEEFINYPIEFLVTEAGIIIPETEWSKQRIRATGHLNYGRDKSEWLEKFTNRAWTPGGIEKISSPDPSEFVQIDRTTHAGHQAFRWEHRYDQVTWSEIMRDLKSVLPKIRIGLESGKLPFGASNNAVGQVWIQNVQDDLNTIVQVKKPEGPGQEFKIVVVTILRSADPHFPDKSLMKILTNGEKSKIEKYGEGSARDVAPKY